MSKLQHEISSNKAQLTTSDDKKTQHKVLVDSVLDTVSGGWINVFANWVRTL